MLPGLCEGTSYGEGAHCEQGAQKGSWRLANWGACVTKCAACARCTYVSFTAKDSNGVPDCSWFHMCNTHRLMPNSSGEVTAQVRRNGGKIVAAAAAAAVADSLAKGNFKWADAEASGVFAAHRLTIEQEAQEVRRRAALDDECARDALLKHFVASVQVMMRIPSRPTPSHPIAYYPTPPIPFHPFHPISSQRIPSHPQLPSDDRPIPALLPSCPVASHPVPLQPPPVPSHSSRLPSRPTLSRPGRIPPRPASGLLCSTPHGPPRPADQQSQCERPTHSALLRLLRIRHAPADLLAQLVRRASLLLRSPPHGTLSSVGVRPPVAPVSWGAELLRPDVVASLGR